ncbi:unnamed protein product [Tilletia controversa]|uniref:Uncharacterized protein n=3 Tax=Tilletia TaxID=13289 RepID=A0A8X7MVU9_9BASI|nr:hypothetical protein CF336_g339 [Tilletia laevis]KAE8206068.1 hypothetical protein CF328_g123 [Tilletia controversa]KAE8263637.1 hypothetical protein A4X03_0g1539 [Tilletia caries]KAE8206456.1 hypothetical protein CF335_g1879 [Tilletia laevis]KAE8252108.1 hypothetical protein A4X06_0g2417 [Tilletia controversa]
MTQSTPIRIQRGGPSDAVARTPTSSTQSPTASPGGRLYGSTPGGSRIVYSREQLMSLASSPLVHAPLQLRNGAQGIPAEIARRPGSASAQASPSASASGSSSSGRRTVPVDPMGSPEKSSMRGMALLKRANAALLEQKQQQQHSGPFGAPLTATSRTPSGTLRASPSGGGGSATRRVSGANKRSDKAGYVYEEGDATMIPSSDLENDDPVRGAAIRCFGGNNVGGGVGSKGLATAAVGEQDGQGRGRNRQPRVSLGTLGAGGQQTVAEGLGTALPLPMEIDDTFGGGGGGGGGRGYGAHRDEKEIASAFLRDAGMSVSRHERGLSSGTASSFASGPPSTRSSISTDAPFVMEL